MAFTNPDAAARKALLERVHVIAVVGLSPKPDRPSFQVARALQDLGYRIIPVRPAVQTILGERAYPTLEAALLPIDLVNVFLAPAHVPAVIDTCLALEINAIWLQEGVIHEAAAHQAQAQGTTVVMNRCIYQDYRRLCR